MALKVTQVRSTIGCKPKTRGTLRALGVRRIGQSNVVAPVNTAVAVNYHCPACTTVAMAVQIVVTLRTPPSPALLVELQADLAQLRALSALGANGTPQAIASEVAAVQQEIDAQLNNSGTLAKPIGSTGTTTSSSSTAPAGSNGNNSSSATTTTTNGQATAPASTSTTSAAPPSASTSTASPPPTTTTSRQTTSTTTSPPAAAGASSTATTTTP